MYITYVFVCMCVCSTTIGEQSVVEYCVLELGVAIGGRCMLSNLHLPQGATVPDGSFLHTVPITMEEGVAYTTFAFGNKIVKIRRF